MYTIQLTTGAGIKRVSSSLAVIASILIFALSVPSYGSSIEKDSKKMKTEQEMLASLVGSWKGSCKTWLRPGQLADESAIKGEFKIIPGSTVLRHNYQSEFKGKARAGEESIAFNSLVKQFQISWFDSFHMSTGLLFSNGKKTEKGFSVLGQYRMSPEDKAWGWRTEFEIKDKDNLVITAYNITPDGQEGKAVEIIYSRVK